MYFKNKAGRKQMYGKQKLRKNGTSSTLAVRSPSTVTSTPEISISTGHAALASTDCRTSTSNQSYKERPKTRSTNLQSVR